MIKASDFITRVLGVKAKAGYIIKDSLSSSILYFFNLSDSSVIHLSDVYIPDTGVEEPSYAGSTGGGAGSTHFYKCSSVDQVHHTWTGYKLTQNNSNGYTLLSNSQLVGLYYIRPVVNGIYDTTGKLRIGNFFAGDGNDPYSDGLLYSIFINGGEAWSSSYLGITTTDNYTSNTEITDGIVARKFNGDGLYVTAYGGTSRTIWSYSVWLKSANYNGMKYAISSRDTGIFGICITNDGNKYKITYGTGSVIYLGSVDKKWHHYTITYDGLQVTVYKDNLSVYSGTDSPGTYSGFIFGTYGSPSSYYDYLGYIANFRFYDHVLTATLIAALYNELTPMNS